MRDGAVVHKGRHYFRFGTLDVKLTLSSPPPFTSFLISTPVALLKDSILQHVKEDHHYHYNTSPRRQESWRNVKHIHGIYCSTLHQAPDGLTGQTLHMYSVLLKKHWEQLYATFWQYIECLLPQDRFRSLTMRSQPAKKRVSCPRRPHK